MCLCVRVSVWSWIDFPSPRATPQCDPSSSIFSSSYCWLCDNECTMMLLLSLLFISLFILLSLSLLLLLQLVEIVSSVISRIAKDEHVPPLFLSISSQRKKKYQKRNKLLRLRVCCTTVELPIFTKRILLFFIIMVLMIIITTFISCHFRFIVITYQISIPHWSKAPSTNLFKGDQHIFAVSDYPFPILFSRHNSHISLLVIALIYLCKFVSESFERSWPN